MIKVLIKVVEFMYFVISRDVRVSLLFDFLLKDTIAKYVKKWNDDIEKNGDINFKEISKIVVDRFVNAVNNENA